MTAVRKTILSAGLALICTGAFAQNLTLTPENIPQIVSAMTLEEKAALLVGGGNDGFVGSGSRMGHQERIVPGAAGTTLPLEKFGIPATVLTDGVAGVHIDPVRKGSDRKYHATGSPIGSCLASTWNPELMYKVAQAIGNETLEYGCDVILGPGMNIHRNPLCGRNFEYYSEDPLVTGVMASAYVRGVQSQGVGTSPKHFAVNSQENDRIRVDERLSQRALREIYLRGFERMVKEGNPWTVMAAYNRINGVYCQENKDLLTTILRDEWGWDGLVETDWIGRRPDLPTVNEVAAGNDLFTPGYPAQAEDIIEGVKSGTLSMEDVDRSVERMLRYIVKTPKFRGYAHSDSPDLDAHARITRQSSTEGMVLLKNKGGVLPLKDVSTVALFGVNSYDFLSGGLGSGCVNVPYVVDMVQGLSNVGISTTSTLTDLYRSYIKYASLQLKADKNPWMWFLDQGQPKLEEIEISKRCTEAEVRNAQAAIITIGRQAGEGIDRTPEEFNLTQREMDMITRVSDAFHAAGKPVIVIINSGSVIETVSWRDKVDAILLAWQPGQEGGNSVADVLSGKQCPSGKLTMTWPYSYTDHPSSANFPQGIEMYTYKAMQDNGQKIKGVDYSNHDEDIYVGYRYFDSFGKDVAYPFGYGLSYTTFEYYRPSVKVSSKGVELKVTVKNTGSVSGKEVVQVYVKAPDRSMEKPVHELRAFAKTGTLSPGESETLSMSIPLRDLASFDEAHSRWLTEEGSYVFEFASSSRDIRQSVEAKVPEYTESVHNVLPLKENLNILSRR